MLPLMAMLLVQVPPPGSDDNAWVWIAGVLAVACGTLFWKLVGAMDERAKASEGREGTCVGKLEVCVTAQRDVTQALREVGAVATDAHAAVGRVEAQLIKNAERMERLERSVREFVNGNGNGPRH